MRPNVTASRLGSHTSLTRLAVGALFLLVGATAAHAGIQNPPTLSVIGGTGIPGGTVNVTFGAVLATGPAIQTARFRFWVCKTGCSNAANWALSATTENPQMRQTTVSQNGWSRRWPAIKAQLPETTRLAMVVQVRPIRSAQAPAKTQPRPPIAIVPKPASAASRGKKPAFA